MTRHRALLLVVALLAARCQRQQQHRHAGRGRAHRQPGRRARLAAGQGRRQCGGGRRHDGAALCRAGGRPRDGESAAQGRCAGEGREPSRQHAVGPGGRQWQRGNDHDAPGRRRRCEYGGVQGTDRADDRRAYRQSVGRAGIDRSRRQRVGPGRHARRERADVGRLRESRRGGVAAAEARRRSQCAVESAVVPEGSIRPRGRAHDPAAWRLAGPDVRGAGRRRPCGRRAGGRRRQHQRRGRRRDDAADSSDSERPLRHGGGPAREGRRSESGGFDRHGGTLRGRGHEYARRGLRTPRTQGERSAHGAGCDCAAARTWRGSECASEAADAYQGAYAR